MRNEPSFDAYLDRLIDEHMTDEPTQEDETEGLLACPTCSSVKIRKGYPTLVELDGEVYTEPTEESINRSLKHRADHLACSDCGKDYYTEESLRFLGELIDGASK